KAIDQFGSCRPRYPPRHRPSQMDIRGPGDAGHDDEDAENFNPASDDRNAVIAQRFETLQGSHFVHIGVSSNPQPASRTSGPGKCAGAVSRLKSVTLLSRST